MKNKLSKKETEQRESAFDRAIKKRNDKRDAIERENRREYIMNCMMRFDDDEISDLIN